VNLAGDRSLTSLCYGVRIRRAALDFTAKARGYCGVGGRDRAACDPVTPYRDDTIDRGATDSAGAGASPPFAARLFIPRLTAWARRTARHSTHGPSRSDGVGVADLGGPSVSGIGCPQHVTLTSDRRVGPACRRGRDFGLVRVGKVLLDRIGFGRPKQDFFLFSFLFLFLSLFKFKLCSNLIQTLVTKYSQMILRHKQYYF
jgi:hypothetical protein